MKKCLLLGLAFLCPYLVFPQCTPSATTIPGVTPDIIDNLPIAYAGNYYSTVLQVRTPLDTTINGTYAKLVRVQINSISNLPSGFSYICNPANCTLLPLSNGCLSITGNPTLAQAGTYLVDINATISVKLYGVIPVTQQVKISDYKIKIVGPPVTNFTLDHYAVCEGETVTFDDKSTNYPTSWLWTFPGGTPGTSTLQNPVITYATAGTYNVTLKATNPAGLNKKTKASILKVNVVPSVKLVTAAPDTICGGDSSLIEAVPVAGSTYQWYKNNTIIAGATKNFYYAKTDGDYSVEITKASSSCKTVSQTRHVKVVILNPMMTAAGSTTVCTPQKVTLNANPSSSLSYTWYKNNVVINGANSSSYSASTTGNYKVRVENGRGCSKSSSQLWVKINSKPSTVVTANGPTTFCVGDDVTLAVNTVNTASFQWLRNNINISGATSKKYVAAQQGHYKIKVTNQYGCTAISPNTIVTVNCRLSDQPADALAEPMKIIVSPNPSSTYATISLDLLKAEHVELTILDAIGKMKSVVADFDYDAGMYEFNINTSAYAPGIYFIRVIAGSNSRTAKLIVN